MESKNSKSYNNTKGSPLDADKVVVHTAVQRMDGRGKTTVEPRKKDPLITRFLRWIYPEQRNASRHFLPPLVALLGTEGSSHEYEIGDISVAGFYMLTSERWLPGTQIPVTLRRLDGDGEAENTIALQAIVIRSGPDGVGFAFVLTEAGDSNHGDSPVEASAGEKALERFLKGLILPEDMLPESYAR